MEWFVYVLGSVGTLAGIYYIAVLFNKYLFAERKRPIDFSKSTSRYEDLGNYDISATALTQDATEKWLRPLLKQPISTDIPRLCKKMIVYNSSGNTLYSGYWTTHPVTNKPMTMATCVGELLVTLARLTKEDHVRIEQSFDNKINDKVDISSHLNDYIIEFVGHNSQIVQILKLCTQSSVSAAVYRLKSTLGRNIAYKDVRGGWKIEIIFYPDKITVTHKKKEQSWNGMDSENEYIEFQWVLEYQLDFPITKIVSSKLYIDEIIFGEKVPSSYKDKLMPHFAKFSKT